MRLGRWERGRGGCLWCWRGRRRDRWLRCESSLVCRSTARWWWWEPAKNEATSAAAAGAVVCGGSGTARNAIGAWMGEGADSLVSRHQRGESFDGRLRKNADGDCACAIALKREIPG